MEKKQSILFGIIGLLVGVLLAGSAAVLAVNNDNRGIMQMMGMNMSRIQDKNAGHGGMAMDDMQTQLQNQTGDDFDKSFIEMMIVHHQGAIDMATLAKQNALHPEIKTMADDIVSAQSKEISMMQNWQREWGYLPASQTDMRMNH